MSINTVQHYIHKCTLKLDYAKQKTFSGPKLNLDELIQSGKVFFGLTSPHSKLFLEIVNVVSSGPKRKRTVRTVMDKKLKSQHL